MMHKILLFFSLSILSGFHTIYELNTVRDEAQDAFEKQDWETAISKYQIILDTAYDERVQLNLAHAYWSQQDTANAELFYAKNYDDPVLQSIALNQMGVITFLGTGITSYQPLDDTQKETVKTSLNFLKEAIKTDKENMLARYNYEVLKYLLEQKLPENNQNQENQQNQQNQDSQQNQQNNDQQQNQQNQDGQQNQQNNDQQQNQQNQDGQQNQQNNDQQQNQQNQDGQQNQQNNDQQQNQDGQQNQQNNDQQQNQQNQDGQQNQQNNDQQQNQQNQDGQQNQQNNDQQQNQQNQDGQQNQQNNDQQQNQQNQDGQQNQQNNDQQGESESLDQTTINRLKDQNMTKEQAQKLLNSAVQQETKYIQQRKKNKGDNNTSNKPDW